MRDNETIIISDVHLGSKYCLYDKFIQFIRALPADITLVLNGDTVDHWHVPVKGKALEALDLLRNESFNRRIIWVKGNHDERYDLKEPGKIEFRSSYNIGKLFILHGCDFDNVMPNNRIFIAIFRFIHILRYTLGAEPIHVAFYAKRFPRLYMVLRKNVLKNAVEYAKRNGFNAVTCGHTHYAEDTEMDGIRYINTGAWTEEPVFYMHVSAEFMKLEKIDGSW